MTSNDKIEYKKLAEYTSVSASVQVVVPDLHGEYKYFQYPMYL